MYMYILLQLVNANNVPSAHVPLYKHVHILQTHSVCHYPYA